MACSRCCVGCLCGVKASSGRPNICDLIQIESSRYMLRGTEETTAAGVPLFCHNAMAGLLELEPAAAPATVLGTESTGRERRARAFHFGDFEHVRRRSFRPRDSHGRGARSSSSSAQVWEVGMGTMGVCGAGGGEAARTLPWRRVAQGEGRWPGLGFVSGGEE